MSRNIKEIGKELMGKSLNSFHRKTGLTQLEENNKMQDGILNGILSQVDDAYIEKTEQSNVIHLDGSGDGVVVLDSIEGNTMVNLIITNMMNFENNSVNAKNITTVDLKPSTTYTFVAHLKDVSSTNTWLARFHFNKISDNSEFYINVAPYQTYTSNSIVKYSFTTPNNDYVYKRAWALWNSTLPTGEKMSFYNALVLEGDWTDKEVPIDLQGLQSSFEEQIEDDKYKIEILSKNNNLIPIDAEFGYLQSSLPTVGVTSYYECYKKTNTPQTRMISEPLELIEGKTMFFKCNNYQLAQIYFDKNKIFLKDGGWLSNTDALNPPQGAKYVASYIRKLDNSLLTDYDLKYVSENAIFGCYNSYSEIEKVTIPHKQNKIKLLINEPLRGINNIKDSLCIKDDKLVVERNCGIRTYQESDLDNVDVLTDMNNTVYILDTPTYEEVLNEYGEPIILEGYENGTLYIDSTIIPTTTVKYTPKMESFNTLKEVYNNNVMLTSDVNDNIIPYMMDVDLMIMEKEMALMSHKNIRKMEVLDMTSMQKRTQDMLERLIKGKSLTEQECKTRVTTYLNAGKITDEQAEELMLLIDEVYA